jgi:uncharacterized protein YndB with AHSA1/START domain
MQPGAANVAGKTERAGYQAGARRTFEISPARAWRLLTSPAGKRIWLGSRSAALRPGSSFRLPGGVEGKLRVFSPGSHLRLAWRPEAWPRASTLQVRVIPSGDRSVIAFHQENMPSASARRSRLRDFQAILASLQSMAMRTSPTGQQRRSRPTD